jgi:hypothetical protein
MLARQFQVIKVTISYGATRKSIHKCASFDLSAHSDAYMHRFH